MSQHFNGTNGIKEKDKILKKTITSVFIKIKYCGPDFIDITGIVIWGDLLCYLHYAKYSAEETDSGNQSLNCKAT